MHGVLSLEHLPFRPVRCAVYTRQSVVRRDQDPALSSCALQRELCTEFVASMSGRGWYVIGEQFDDEGHSGATVERPGLDRLLARIQEGGVGRVVVYRLDRLTRKLADWARLVRAFEHCRVGLTMVRGAIHAEAGSLSRLQLNTLAAFAELERDMIRERLADARAARKAHGRRGHWYPRAVLRILRNPVYAGLLQDGTPAIHTALVTRSLFDDVQSLIAERRTRTPTFRTAPNDWHDPFILRGLLICELCGKAMTTSMSTALTKRSARRAPRYYRCRTQGCAGGQVAAAEIEAMAYETLRHPRHGWPPEARERLTQLASTWDVLWPVNRRRALAVSFEQLTWRSRTRRLLVKLRSEEPSTEEPPAA